MNTWKKRAPKTLLALTGIAGLVLAATGCSSGSSDGSGGKITFVGYGNETQEYQLEAFGEPFAEDTGTQVVSDSPIDLAKLKAMVDSGNNSMPLLRRRLFYCLAKLDCVFPAQRAVLLPACAGQ